MRGLLEYARPEDEHEAAGPTIGPFHQADAGDSRLNHAAEHIKPNRVAQADLELRRDRLLHRHLADVRRCRLPEFAGHDRFVRLETLTIGNGVFTPQRATAADVLVVLEIHFLALDADHPRAQHRQ